MFVTGIKPRRASADRTVNNNYMLTRTYTRWTIIDCDSQKGVSINTRRTKCIEAMQAYHHKTDAFVYSAVSLLFITVIIFIIIVVVVVVVVVVYALPRAKRVK